MRKLTYYVAVTLDGFIAGPDGEFDFFPFEGEFAAEILTEFPETIPGQAREPLGLTGVPNKRFDTVVMGRGTYEPALRIGITSPYPQLRQYVVSTTLTSTDPEVEIVSGDPVEFVRDLKRGEGGGIWLAGGGKLAGALLDQIDELIVKRSPIVAGAGIPMFDAAFGPVRFAPADSRGFAEGVTISTYTRM